jgi:hypothetical protein
MPGRSAAGINLGTSVADVLQGNSDLVQDPPVAGWSAIRGSFVTLVARDGIVHEVIVHGEYCGKLRDLIGVGSPVAQVTAILGTWHKGTYGNEIEVPAVPGVFFETEPPGPKPPDQAIVVRIRVSYE